MDQEPENQRSPADQPSGKDEMNLAEFPIALLTDRVPDGVKTIKSEDEFFDERTGRVITRRRIITGSDEYGLPTATDDEVVIGLIQLTREANNFTERTVYFSRGELVQKLKWPDNGKSYKRLALSFARWTSVSLHYEKAWYDNARKSWVDEHFHIIDRVSLYDKEEQRQQPQLKLSSFTWSEPIFRSFQAGYLKRFDLDFYSSLSSATAKRLYRFLDKRFYLKPRWDFDLKDFAFNHIGLTRRGYEGNGHVAKQLRPAIQELEARGFLEPLTEQARFERRSRGEWRVHFVRGKGVPSALPLFEPEAAPALPGSGPSRRRRSPSEPEPTPLERELIRRGVTASTARALVAEFPEGRIAAQVEHFDWLQAKHPKKVRESPGGYLADSIRKDYAPPEGFESKAERAKREEAARQKERAEALERTRKARARAREEEFQLLIGEHLEALSPSELEALDREVFADPEVKATYEGQVPNFRRLYLDSLRKDRIRMRLNLPDPPEG